VRAIVAVARRVVRDRAAGFVEPVVGKRLVGHHGLRVGPANLRTITRGRDTETDPATTREHQPGNDCDLHVLRLYLVASRWYGVLPCTPARGAMLRGSETG